MSELTDERGSDYGPPWEHHGKTAAILNVLGISQPFTAIDWQIAMIVDKLVRLVHAVKHGRKRAIVDSLKDIGGYSECALMTLDHEADEALIENCREHMESVSASERTEPWTRGFVAIGGTDD
jgi:hypothetical protein